MEISQDKILRQGNYGTVERQSLYDDHILALCHSATLNAWDRIEEVGENLSHLPKLFRAKRKPLWVSYKD